MKKEGESYYKHFIPEIELSIERNTGMVPADGKFHVVKDASPTLESPPISQASTGVAEWVG